MIWSRVAETLRPRPMTLQQLNLRVQQEADARFGETIEHLLRLLEYEHLIKQSVRRCYCGELKPTNRSFFQDFIHEHQLCENCRDS